MRLLSNGPDRSLTVKRLYNFDRSPNKKMIKADLRTKNVGDYIKVYVRINDSINTIFQFSKKVPFQ